MDVSVCVELKSARSSGGARVVRGPTWQSEGLICGPCPSAGCNEPFHWVQHSGACQQLSSEPRKSAARDSEGPPGHKEPIMWPCFGAGSGPRRGVWKGPARQSAGTRRPGRAAPSRHSPSKRTRGCQLLSVIVRLSPQGAATLLINLKDKNEGESAASRTTQNWAWF